MGVGGREVIDGWQQYPQVGHVRGSDRWEETCVLGWVEFEAEVFETIGDVGYQLFECSPIHVGEVGEHRRVGSSYSEVTAKFT